MEWLCSPADFGYDALRSPIGLAPQHRVDVVHKVVPKPGDASRDVGHEAERRQPLQKRVDREIVEPPPRLADVPQELRVTDQVEAARDLAVAARRIGRTEALPA